MINILTSNNKNPDIEETYPDDKKLINKALMRSRPCLTLRRLRDRLPGDFTVSFFIS